MSGIYGIYQFDGAPVASQWLDRMRDAMAYYGPHGGGSSVEGTLGLGHLLLEVNPEDAFESQPVAGERGPVVSAARLDNRAALLEAFNVSALQASRLSDGHLVSLAFDRWGDELSSRLQGDWALAAWDARQRRLLLARDASGNATLYYYEGKGFIAFASSLKALLALPGVIKEPDRLRLAQVLVSWQHDAQLTAYKGFRRLVMGHAMTVHPGGQIHGWRHWTPEGRDQLNYRRDEEYEEAFLEHYTRAVQSSLRTQKAVAATLSGGRDSGSVVTMAAPLLARQGRAITAYTSVPWLPPEGSGKTRLGNEWEMAHATAAMAGANVSHVPIDASGYGVIQGIEYLLNAHDGPSHAASNHYWLHAINDAACQSGTGVVLTGQFGNATVSWAGSGSALLALVKGYQRTAFRLLLRGEPNPWLTLKRQVLKPMLTPGLRALRRIRSPHSEPLQAYSALNLHMALEVDLKGRMQAAGWDPTFALSPWEDAHLRFFWPVFGIGFGIWAEMAAKHSFSYVDPTANLSLVEFILRVPDEQFRFRGQSSWLLRRAFRNRLPDAVLNGRQKGLQAADVGHRILRELPAFRESLSSLDSLPEAREMLDMAVLHRCLDDLVAKVDPETTARAGAILLRGLGVGLFLRRLADSRA
jgi:asparagine synthase (glutamine-hydrolysing)